MNKKSFILYLDQQDLFNKLPDEIAGKLIKHIFSYVNCENPETDDLVLNIAFESIKQCLKRDLKSWEKQREQRSQAGKKSAESRANKAQRNSTKSTGVKSRSTKSTVSVNDSVSVSDKDKTYTSSPKVSDPVPFSKIVDLYHEKLPELPKVEKLTTTRKGYIRQRWIEDLPDIDHWKNYFDYIRQSDFLMGKTQPNGDRRPFRCSLEWLTKPANYAKVSEDTYHV